VRVGVPSLRLIPPSHDRIQRPLQRPRDSLDAYPTGTTAMNSPRGSPKKRQHVVLDQKEYSHHTEASPSDAAASSRFSTAAAEL